MFDNTDNRIPVSPLICSGFILLIPNYLLESQTAYFDEKCQLLDLYGRHLYNYKFCIHDLVHVRKLTATAPVTY